MADIKLYEVHHAVRLEGSWRLYVKAEKRLCSKTKGVPEEDSGRVPRAGVLGVCELPDIDAREHYHGELAR